MNGSQGLDGLELDNDAVSDEQVKTAFTDSMTFVLDLDQRLPLISEIPKPELKAKSMLVDRLEKAWSENPMNLDGRGEHRRNMPVQVL